MDYYETITTAPLERWEPWVPPKTGSKRYQRRRAQRWPKGK